MKDVFAPRDRLVPAGVLGQVRDHELEVVGGLRTAYGEHRTNIGLTFQAPHRSAHEMSGIEELQDRVGSDEAGSAGDEYGTHGAARCEDTVRHQQR